MCCGKNGMIIDNFLKKDIVKFCSYPKEAPGWIDGVYYPRVMNVSDTTIVNEKGGSARFHVKAWKEIEETGYGVYFYEEAPNVVLKLDNVNYDVTIVLANPTDADYKAHVRANNVVKAAEVIVESGKEQEVSFAVPVYTGELRLSILPGFLSELSAEALEGDIYIKEIRITECAAKEPATKPTLFLASDSTVQPYGEKNYPQTGWGQPLYLFFGPEKEGEDLHLADRVVELPGIIINNRAIAGRSSRSFLEEGRLDEILLAINKGDFVLIQWAHNDGNKVRPNRYVSPVDYPVFIGYYVDGILQRGATPILVTAVTMRNCDWNENKEFTIAFPEYRYELMKFAAERNLPLIDLGKKSCELVAEHGPEGSKSIYMWIKEGQYPDSAFAAGCTDNAHLKVYGAMLFANIVAKSIAEYDADDRLDVLKELVCPRDYIENPEEGMDWSAGDEEGVIGGFLMHELSIDGAQANFLLNWNRVEKASLYRVYRREKSEKDYAVVREVTKDEKDNATTLPFAAPANKIYEFYVAAFDEAGKEISKSKVIEVKAM